MRFVNPKGKWKADARNEVRVDSYVLTVPAYTFYASRVSPTRFLSCPNEWRAFAKVGEERPLEPLPGRKRVESAARPQVPRACPRRRGQAGGDATCFLSSVNNTCHLSSLWKQLSFISSQKKGNVIKENYEVTKLLAALCLASVAPAPSCFPVSHSRERKQTSDALYPPVAVRI